MAIGLTDKVLIKNKMSGKKLIDVLDEMNLKEDTTNEMVVGKLNKLAQRIFKINKYSDVYNDIEKEDERNLQTPMNWVNSDVFDEVDCVCVCVLV